VLTETVSLRRFAEYQSHLHASPRQSYRRTCLLERVRAASTDARMDGTMHVSRNSYQRLILARRISCRTLCSASEPAKTVRPFHPCVRSVHVEHPHRPDGSRSVQPHLRRDGLLLEHARQLRRRRVRALPRRLRPGTRPFAPRSRRAA
jgi:hypothetical protein